MIDTYLFEESSGHTSIEGNTIDSLNSFLLITKYLFNSTDPVKILYKDERVTVFDLNAQKANIVSFEDLDKFFLDWIQTSKREHSMDEYGMLIGLIGYIRRHQDKKFLVATLYER